ncbi:MAG TPA: hypothetical protein VN893_18840 [Bryobacteraceae bacterium]|nr:hypothetical protein [Bryobacteraceae bacterium]
MKHDTRSSFSCWTRGTMIQTLWLLGMSITTAAGILLIALLKPALPIRILAVAVPVVCGIAYSFRLLRDLAKLDELQLRIQLEAAATACLGVFLVTILYPVLQIAGFVGPLQPYYVIFLLVGLLLAGYLNANRRYR